MKPLTTQSSQFSSSVSQFSQLFSSSVESSFPKTLLLSSIEPHCWTWQDSMRAALRDACSPERCQEICSAQTMGSFSQAPGFKIKAKRYGLDVFCRARALKRTIDRRSTDDRPTDGPTLRGEEKRMLGFILDACSVF